MKILISVFLSLVFVSAVAIAGEKRAEATSARVLFHLPYTETADKAHRLDVYIPDGATDRPVVVWVHGGSWVRGDKALAQRKPQAFTARNYVFVAINYRFVPDVMAGDQAADVAKAIKYVHDNCSKWGGNPKKLFIMGHSAGTHLSALVCTDESYLKAEGLDLSNIAGCVAVDVAGYDLKTRYEKAGANLRKILAPIFGADAKSQSHVSPICHVAAKKGIPPFLVIHIGLDPQKSQSLAFVKKLTAAGVSAKVHSAKGKGHKKLDEEMGMNGDAPTNAVFKFLDSLSKK
jgi:arylformamidase